MGAAQPAGCKPDERCCGQRDPQAEFVHDPRELAAEAPGITSWAVLDDSPRPPSGSLPEQGPNAEKLQHPRDSKSSGEDTGGDQVMLKYKDSSTYRGQAVDGKRHGEGVWSSPEGEYTGQWRCDLQDGYGKQVWQDGRVFQGHFYRGSLHGRGRMEWQSDAGIMYYEGEYMEDMKHGRGRFVWADGRSYEGEWLCGRRSGCGQYFNSSGHLRRGIWKDDVLERWIQEEDPSQEGGLLVRG
mmetsp:Transcript_87277/g.260362  ORF Transcript_87277/g.260362 Transcript_87277/m.260362 type:complete len:240 (+) Transcript_87277:78-797(+)